MKEDNNLHVFGIQVIATKRRRDGSAAIRLAIEDSNQEWHTLKAWECPSGRPTPDQSEDIAAAVGCELVANMVTLLGVQGVLPV